MIAASPKQNAVLNKHFIHALNLSHPGSYENVFKASIDDIAYATVFAHKQDQIRNQ